MSLYPIVPNAIVPRIARIDILRLLFDLMAYSFCGPNSVGARPRHCLRPVMLSRGSSQSPVECGVNGSADFQRSHRWRHYESFEQKKEALRQRLFNRESVGRFLYCLKGTKDSYARSGDSLGSSIRTNLLQINGDRCLLMVAH